VPPRTQLGSRRLRAPILPLMEPIVVRASDRHRQLPSYLHSAAIFSRLLTRSNETELEVSVRARLSRCKIKNLARPTRFERVTFAFGGQGSRHSEGKRDQARNAGGREVEVGADLGEDEADAAWAGAFALDAGLFT
jgi:hypothetical protein